MKKAKSTNRKRLIPIAIITLAVAVYAFVSGGLGIHSAQVIRTDSGRSMVLMDNSPVLITDRTPRGNAFRKYSTGDKILLICGPVAESMPGQTVMHWCVKLDGGDYADIPAEITEMLDELGYTVTDNIPGEN